MKTPMFFSDNNNPNNGNNRQQFPRVFSQNSSSNNQPVTTVNRVLGLKQLRFETDPAGKRISSDGRKPNPNTALAEAIAYRYDYFEPLHTKIRAISSQSSNAGIISYPELFPIPSAEIINLVNSLKDAGIITRYTNYGTCAYIEINPDAKYFYDKEFAVLHLLNHIRKNNADEIYYNCTLANTYDNERFVIDLMYRQGNSVTFCVTALSTKIMFPAQFERIVKLANRFKNITLIVSSSINTVELTEKLRYSLNQNVSVKLVPFHQVYLM